MSRFGSVRGRRRGHSRPPSTVVISRRSYLATQGAIGFAVIIAVVAFGMYLHDRRGATRDLVCNVIIKYRTDPEAEVQRDRYSCPAAVPLPKLHRQGPAAAGRARSSGPVRATPHASSVPPGARRHTAASRVAPPAAGRRAGAPASTVTVHPGTPRPPSSPRSSAAVPVAPGPPPAGSSTAPVPLLTTVCGVLRPVVPLC